MLLNLKICIKLDTNLLNFQKYINQKNERMLHWFTRLHCVFINAYIIVFLKKVESTMTMRTDDLLFKYVGLTK